VKVSEELDILIKLQEIDNKIRQLRANINSAEERRKKIEEEFEKQAFEIRQIQQANKQASSNRLKLEAKIAEVTSHLQRAERNLRNAHNQKEYEAAMREADVLRKQLSGLETEMLEKIEKIEETERVLKQRAEEIASLETKRRSALDEFEASLEKDQLELKAISKKREELFSRLTPLTAQIYETLVGRTGVAVVKVLNDSCSYCFMTIRPQVIVELRRGEKIVTCESCTRILYIASVEATA